MIRRGVVEAYEHYDEARDRPVTNHGDTMTLKPANDSLTLWSNQSLEHPVD